MNITVIFAAMSTSYALVKIRSEKKFRPVWDFNP